MRVHGHTEPAPPNDKLLTFNDGRSLLTNSFAFANSGGMLSTVFATEFDKSKYLAGAPVAQQTSADAPEQKYNMLWQSLALRTSGSQTKSDVSSAKLADLGYGPVVGQPAAGPVGQIPPVQALPVGGPAAALPVAPAAPPAPLGPIEQARKDSIDALDFTVERVKAAISARDGIGIIPRDVDYALNRFFPGYGEDFLDDILARIQPMSGWIPGIVVRSVPRNAPVGYRDRRLINQINWNASTLVRREIPGMDPGPDYCLVFPEWYAEGDKKATQLLHEFFHYSFVGMKHVKGLNSAWAWQGFVSIVGGLPTGPGLDRQYPP